MKRPSIVLLVVAVVLIAIGFLYFRDRRGPEVSLTPAAGSASGKREFTLSVKDEGSDLKQLTITAIQEGRSWDILSKTYPPGIRNAQESFTLGTAELQQGPFELKISSGDTAIYHFGAGNTSELTSPFEYDNKAPMVSVLSTAHNLYQGGAGLVVYTLSEKPVRTGIIIGEAFYPGYLQEGEIYACLFPFAYDSDPKTFPAPRVVAIDEAGNKGDAGIYYRLLSKRFAKADIRLDDSFLTKIQAEFQDSVPAAASPLDFFLNINRDVRSKNRQALADYGLQTSPVPLWQGGFLRQTNTAMRGPFGEQRTYQYKGKTVDRQTHLGIDLASVAHAPVQAANDGKVVFADRMGIYGNCIIIDHGLGLQTLYGHLSRIDVKKGDPIRKGQLIAHSGASGLAGGDHLHFGVIISGIPVNPIEWWDPSWIKNNVTNKLKMAKQNVTSP